MYYVYLLKCGNNTEYVGCTNMSFWENYKKALKKEWGEKEIIEENAEQRGSSWNKKLSRDEIFLGIIGVGIIIFIAYNVNLPTAVGAGVLYYFLTRIIAK